MSRKLWRNLFRSRAAGYLTLRLRSRQKRDSTYKFQFDSRDVPVNAWKDAYVEIAGTLGDNVTDFNHWLLNIGIGYRSIEAIRFDLDEAVAFLSVSIFLIRFSDGGSRLL